MNKTTRGDCYKQAVDLLYENSNRENLRLVHGYPRLTEGKDKGKKFGHAWIEFTETLRLSHPIVLPYCIDGLMPDQPLSKHLYYEVGRIDPEECSFYLFNEALSNLDKFEHFGPWTDKVPDALFTESKT